MSVEKAATQILKAMALGRTEFILGGLIYQLAPFLALSEAFMERYQASKLKSQIAVK